MAEWTLRCERCDALTPASLTTWRCPACAGPLAWSTTRRFTRADIDVTASGFWRYGAVLPVEYGNTVSFGESVTPLVGGHLDGFPLWFKLDYLLPSGSYKDRGAAVMISALRSLGMTHAVEDSSGNAAAAVAAYSARAGIPCTVFAPATASPAKLIQSAALGARVERVTGSRDDVARAAMAAAAATPGATYASHNWHPFFIEGVKTWALEVWAQGLLPRNVVATVGSGSMLLGAALAFAELRAGGELAELPRLFAVQPAACAPVVQAFETGATDVTPFAIGATIAEGAAIANPVRGREVLAAIRASNGGAVAVPEEAIVAALRDLGRQGFFVEPTAAVAAAGAWALLASGAIAPAEPTVVLLSGSGLKATETIGRELDIA